MANPAPQRGDANMKVILERLASASAELEQSASSHKVVLQRAETWDRHLSDTSAGVRQMATSLDKVVAELQNQGQERRDLLKLQSEERKALLDAQDPRKTVPLSLVLLLFGVVGVLLIFDRVARTDRNLELDGTRLRIYKQGSAEPETAEIIVEKPKGEPPSAIPQPSEQTVPTK